MALFTPNCLYKASTGKSSLVENKIRFPFKKMGQCTSQTKQVTNYFTDDESAEWQKPNLVGQSTKLNQIEQNIQAQRDVLALLESQLSVLSRDEELFKTALMDNLDDEEHDVRIRKLRRKRRRNLTYYRSKELLVNA